MVASPIIRTPHGERELLIEFGRPADADKLRGWRVSAEVDSAAIQDAMEFGKLAGKRWRYYLRRNEAAQCVDSLVSGILQDPQAEIGFLLVAKPSWKPAPNLLGIAWCRRTWCNHIVLDFLAVHPKTLGPEKGYAGVGTALLYSLAAVAGKIEAPLVWGEATALSASFYRRVLDTNGILDHFFIPEVTLAKMRAQLTLRSRKPPSSNP